MGFAYYLLESGSLDQQTNTSNEIGIKHDFSKYIRDCELIAIH